MRSKIYNSHQTVLISPGSTTENLTISGYKYFFRTVPSVQYHVKPLVDYLIQDWKQNKAAIFYIEKNSSFSRSICEKFQEYYQSRKGEIVAKFVGQGNTTDFSGKQFNVKLAIKQAGASGRIQFDNNGNRINPPQLLVKVEKDSNNKTGLAFQVIKDLTSPDKVSQDLTSSENKCK